MLRKQLRWVHGVRYPQIVKNRDVYERSNEEHLPPKILKARWQLFDHTVRYSGNTLDMHTMQYNFLRPSNGKFKRRARTTLPVKLNNNIVNFKRIDEKYMIRSFKDISDLQKFEEIANGRERWRDMCKVIYDAAQAEAFPNTVFPRLSAPSKKPPLKSEVEQFHI